jgi:hypothetical protein
MAPYSRAIQKASGAGWLVSKVTGEDAFVVIRPHKMHEWKTSTEHKTFVRMDITPSPSYQFVPFNIIILGWKQMIPYRLHI